MFLKSRFTKITQLGLHQEKQRFLSPARKTEIYQEFLSASDLILVSPLSTLANV